MKHLSLLLLLCLLSFSQSNAADKLTTINIIETSDVHGNLFPYDFINRRPGKGSLARVATYLRQQRKKHADNGIYIDNGDLLQGQPSIYYYNFIDTVSRHLAAAALNFMKCDVGNIGNHGIETGHAVYDRWIKDCHFPVLGANIIDRQTGKPYLKPYEIIERDGVKIAVLGMITPAIPCWLPEVLWQGLYFEDMEECARRWVKTITDSEHPDLIIGLFHAGQDGTVLGEYKENPTLSIAQNIPGFDVLFFGHDHRRECRKVTNCRGDSVLLINPMNNAHWVSSVTISIKKNNGKLVSKTIEGHLEDIDNYDPDAEYLEAFSRQYNAIDSFVSRRIGSIDSTIKSSEAFYGPSAFIDLLHQLQLHISGADISFCAPLSPDAVINKGDILVADMFNLYKYENLLYVMSLTGREIKDYLEMSYSLWTRQISSPGDNFLLLRENTANDNSDTPQFLNPSFNFDSAAGILYTVDVTKPKGEKISIISMADGTPFSMDKAYKCAINSYRGNGGGDLLTKGAGIPKEQLSQRVLSSTERDLRYYLMEYIIKHGNLHPAPLNHWRFIGR